MSETAVAVTYSVEPSKMQLVACCPSVISSSTSPSGESTVRPPEIVVHTNSRPSAANAMPSGTWLSLSWQKVVTSPSSQRRTACAIDSVQYIRPRPSKAMPFGYTFGRSASISPPPSASSTNSLPVAGSAERQVVGTGQRVARDLRREQLDAAVRVDPLDAADRALVARAGDVASLGDIDRAVGAEHRAPRGAAGDRVDAHLAVLPDLHLAGVSVTEHHASVRHDHGALGEAEIRGEQGSFHRSRSFRAGEIGIARPKLV